MSELSDIEMKADTAPTTTATTTTSPAPGCDTSSDVEMASASTSPAPAESAPSTTAPSAAAATAAAATADAVLTAVAVAAAHMPSPPSTPTKRAPKAAARSPAKSPARSPARQKRGRGRDDSETESDSEEDNKSEEPEKENVAAPNSPPRNKSNKTKTKTKTKTKAKTKAKTKSKSKPKEDDDDFVPTAGDVDSEDEQAAGPAQVSPRTAKRQRAAAAKASASMASASASAAMMDHDASVKPLRRRINHMNIALSLQDDFVEELLTECEVALHPEPCIVSRDDAQADVLITDGLRRTMKLLFALARGSAVVTPDWAVQSVLRAEWLDTEHFEHDYATKRKQAAPEAPLGGHCIILNGFEQPLQRYLGKLVQLLGATVATAFEDATLHIVPATVCEATPGVPTVHMEWLLQGIIAGPMPPIEEYQLKEATATAAAQKKAAADPATTAAAPPATATATAVA